MAHPLELPRSVVLALWLQSGAGRAALPAVVGDDEPHELAGDHEDLGGLIEGLARSTDVAAVLPAPGDPLVGPAEATAAGECVLVRDAEGRDLALVPEVRRFGSRLEPGAMVTWRTHEIPEWRTTFQAAVGSIDEAERSLREGLLLATRALVTLDVARWRPDAAERIAAARDGGLPTGRLPTQLAARPQQVRVLQQAARLRAIVELATEDEGGAVNLWQSDQRLAALRDVDRLARRAMSAASARLAGETGRDRAERRTPREEGRTGGEE